MKTVRFFKLTNDGEQVLDVELGLVDERVAVVAGDPDVGQFVINRPVFGADASHGERFLDRLASAYPGGRFWATPYQEHEALTNADNS